MTDEEIIAKAVAGEEVTVSLNDFCNVDSRRSDLMKAAFEQIEPIEIVVRSNPITFRPYLLVKKFDISKTITLKQAEKIAEDLANGSMS